MMNELAIDLALALGQDPILLKQIENSTIHPAMAAFGLWKDETDLDEIGTEIKQNRQNQPSRMDIVF